MQERVPGDVRDREQPAHRLLGAALKSSMTSAERSGRELRWSNGM